MSARLLRVLPLELVVPDRLEILAGIQTILRAMVSRVEQLVNELLLQLDKMTHHYALRQPASLVDQKSQYVDDLTRRIQTQAAHSFNIRKQTLDSLQSHLSALSPRGVMKRGYAIIEGSRGYIGSVKKIAIGETARVHLHDGILESQIIGKHEQIKDPGRGKQ